MSKPPVTVAVITATVERDTVSGSSRFEELFKIEYQSVDEDTDEQYPMLFRYNNGGYAYLETLPEENPVAQARDRIEDYILDAQLVTTDLKPRETNPESEQR